MRIAEIRIRFSVPESVAANMPEADMRVIERKLTALCMLLRAVADHAPSGVTVEVG
jgi:hypothetical protein